MKAVNVTMYYYIDFPCNNYAERIARDTLFEKCSYPSHHGEILFKNKQSAINAAKFTLMKMVSANNPYKVEFEVSDYVETYSHRFFNVSVKAHYLEDSFKQEVVKREIIVDGVPYYNEATITLPLRAEAVESYTLNISTKQICVADDIFTEETIE